MHSKKGFTLIEVLIVVAISLSVLIFAVPSYKKTQAKAKFEAAQGVMISIGTGVNLMREKIHDELGDDCSHCKFPTTTKKIDVTSTTTSDETYDYTAPVGVTDDGRIKAMFAQKIAPLIPFDDTTNKTYKGYYVYICQEGGSGSQCCVNTNAVACIQLKTTTDTDKPFYRAYYTKDGEIVKLAKD